jgi:hypothetical protein
MFSQLDYIIRDMFTLGPMAQATPITIMRGVSYPSMPICKLQGFLIYKDQCVKCKVSEYQVFKMCSTYV